MTTDFKNVIDAIAGVLTGLGVIVTNLVTIVAGLFAIAWYGYRFYHELWKPWKEGKDNGNKRID